MLLPSACEKVYNFSDDLSKDSFRRILCLHCLWCLLYCIWSWNRTMHRVSLNPSTAHPHHIFFLSNNHLITQRHFYFPCLILEFRDILYYPCLILIFRDFYTSHVWFTTLLLRDFLYFLVWITSLFLRDFLSFPCLKYYCVSQGLFLLTTCAHPGHFVQGRFEQEPQPAACGAPPICPASSPGLVSFFFFLFRLSFCPSQNRCLENKK